MDERQDRTGRRGAPIRRTVRAMVAMVATVAIVTLAWGVGPAAAFEPPVDPNDNFGCDGGPVAGHPGQGLPTAMAHAASPTAWNAVNNADPVSLCD